MRLKNLTSQPLRLPVVVAIFASLAAALSPFFAEGWRHMQRMDAGRRTWRTVEACVRQDARFARIKFAQSSSGAVLIGGEIDSPPDVLALRTLVDSTVPTARVDIDVTARGRWVPGNVSRQSFDRWLEAQPK